jgi:hypothetical protein
VVQHNCANGKEVVVMALETGVELGADLVIMQEQRKPGVKGSLASHPAYGLTK